jgi:threonine aldolase
MHRIVDLRSDTVTLPTPEMREAMFRAEVGDTQAFEDPTVNRLEAMAAEMLGKEASLFVCSGTMGNLLGALSNCERGDEIILESNTHQANAEAANLAFVGGFMTKPIPGLNGLLNPDDIEAAIRKPSRYYPRTGQISIENTHNRVGGVVVPLEHMEAISRVSKRYGIPLYLDGARIFDAVVALGVDVKEAARHVDSLSFCLSKGLSCPAGSLLVGTRDFIERARRFKQMVGGYMRQTGILAAAGIVALETMIDRLAEDHKHARLLGEKINKMEGLRVNLELLQTNMAYFEIEDELAIDAPEFVKRLEQHGVRGLAVGPRRIRLVAHYGIEREDIAYALDCIETVAEQATGDTGRSTLAPEAEYAG